MAAPGRAHHVDYPLAIALAILVIGGLFVVASASSILSSNRFGGAHYYATHQLLYGAGIGAAAFIITLNLRYTIWKTLALPLLVASLLLMALTLFPNIGLTLKGASRWISVGPVTFQPAEALKLSFIIYLASWIASKKRDIGNLKRGLLPFLVMLGLVSIFFVLQKDLGTLGILGLTAIFLFFASGARMSQIGLLIILGLLAGTAFIWLEPYRVSRLLVFTNQKLDPQGIGYQINQALIAIGSGGVFGRGFGMSRQKFNYLPEAASDSIFAVFGEEFGFVGSIGLVSLFLFFFWRGIRVSTHSADPFARALAAGISLLVATQAFINIGAISGLLPLAGVPLSFISYGSSALIMNMAAAGILLNISKYTR